MKASRIAISPDGPACLTKMSGGACLCLRGPSSDGGHDRHPGAAQRFSDHHNCLRQCPLGGRARALGHAPRTDACFGAWGAEAWSHAFRREAGTRHGTASSRWTAGHRPLLPVHQQVVSVEKSGRASVWQGSSIAAARRFSGLVGGSSAQPARYSSRREKLGGRSRR